MEKMVMVVGFGEIKGGGKGRRRVEGVVMVMDGEIGRWWWLIEEEGGGKGDIRGNDEGGEGDGAWKVA